MDLVDEMKPELGGRPGKRFKMIIRLSTKLATKLKVKTAGKLPLYQNSMADWSAHLFNVGRTQYVIITNTQSLYSVVVPGRGMIDSSHFIEGVLACIRETMDADGLADVFDKQIAPAIEAVQFSKALSRSVTGSMNDMIFHAKAWLSEDSHSPLETSNELNDIPFSSLYYNKPRKVLQFLAGTSGSTNASTKNSPNGNERIQNKALSGNDRSEVLGSVKGVGKPKPMSQKKGKAKTNAMLTASQGVVYQFKITLKESNPAIWRRIQVRDCTLDQLHEHIQSAMGWFNCHLHQFDIKKELFADPELFDGEFEGVDSTRTMVSDVVPKTSKRFAFSYLYDFGDSWEHEILFEGIKPAESGSKYPLCLEGTRACPPEDVGGVWGFQNFMAAIKNPKHEEHESFLEWCGGKFSPDQFDPAKATKKMRKGLPNWRNA